MTIGIFGAGHIGANLARVFAGAGETVTIAGSGGPETVAVRLGGAPGITAVVAERVPDADIVVLAVPWAALPSLWRFAERLRGKIVLDVTNPYKPDLSGVEDLGGERSSAFVARHLPGARLVKSLNTLYYKYLIGCARPRGAPDRIALPTAGDDAEAKRVVMALLDRAGFTPVDAGSIAESGAQEPDRPLYNRPWSEPDLRRALAGLRIGAAA